MNFPSDVATLSQCSFFGVCLGYTRVNVYASRNEQTMDEHHLRRVYEGSLFHCSSSPSAARFVEFYDALQNISTTTQKLLSSGEDCQQSLSFGPFTLESSTCLLAECDARSKRLVDWTQHLALASRNYPSLLLFTPKQLSECRQLISSHSRMDSVLLTLVPHLDGDVTLNRTDTPPLLHLYDPHQDYNGDWVSCLGKITMLVLKTFPSQHIVDCEAFLPFLRFSTLLGQDHLGGCVFLKLPQAYAGSGFQALFSIALFLANVQRFPQHFEMLLCTPSTTTEDVDVVLKRRESFAFYDEAASYPTQLLFLIANVDALSGAVSAHLVSQLSIDRTQFTFCRMELIFCGHSDLLRKAFANSGVYCSTISAEIAQSTMRLTSDFLRGMEMWPLKNTTVLRPADVFHRDDFVARKWSGQDNTSYSRIAPESEHHLLQLLQEGNESLCANCTGIYRVDLDMSGDPSEKNKMLLSLLVFGRVSDGSYVFTRRPSDLYIFIDHNFSGIPLNCLFISLISHVESPACSMHHQLLAPGAYNGIYPLLMGNDSNDKLLKIIKSSLGPEVPCDLLEILQRIFCEDETPTSSQFDISSLNHALRKDHSLFTSGAYRRVFIFYGFTTILLLFREWAPNTVGMMEENNLFLQEPLDALVKDWLCICSKMAKTSLIRPSDDLYRLMKVFFGISNPLVDADCDNLNDKKGNSTLELKWTLFRHIFPSFSFSILGQSSNIFGCLTLTRLYHLAGTPIVYEGPAGVGKSYIAQLYASFSGSHVTTLSCLRSNSESHLTKAILGAVEVLQHSCLEPRAPRSPLEALLIVEDIDCFPDAWCIKTILQHGIVGSYCIPPNIRILCTRTTTSQRGLLSDEMYPVVFCIEEPNLDIVVDLSLPDSHTETTEIQWQLSTIPNTLETTVIVKVVDQLISRVMPSFPSFEAHRIHVLFVLVITHALHFIPGRARRQLARQGTPHPEITRPPYRGSLRAIALWADMFTFILTLYEKFMGGTKDSIMLAGCTYVATLLCTDGLWSLGERKELLATVRRFLTQFLTNNDDLVNSGYRHLESIARQVWTECHVGEINIGLDLFVGILFSLGGDPGYPLFILSLPGLPDTADSVYACLAAVDWGKLNRHKSKEKLPFVTRMHCTVDTTQEDMHSIALWSVEKGIADGLLPVLLFDGVDSLPHQAMAQLRRIVSSGVYVEGNDIPYSPRVICVSGTLLDSVLMDKFLCILAIPALSSTLPASSTPITTIGSSDDSLGLLNPGIDFPFILRHSCPFSGDSCQRPLLLVGHPCSILELLRFESIKDEQRQIRLLVGGHLSNCPSYFVREVAVLKEAMAHGYTFVLLQACHLCQFLRSSCIIQRDAGKCEVRYKGSIDTVMVNPNFRLISIASQLEYTSWDSETRATFIKMHLSHPSLLNADEYACMVHAYNTFNCLLEDVLPGDATDGPDTVNVLEYLVPGFTVNTFHAMWQCAHQKKHSDPNDMMERILPLVKRMISPTRLLNSSQPVRDRFHSAFQGKDDLASALRLLSGAGHHTVIFTSQHYSTENDYQFQLHRAMTAVLRDAEDFLVSNTILSLMDMSALDIRCALEAHVSQYPNIPLLFRVHAPAHTTMSTEGSTHSSLAIHLQHLCAALTENLFSRLRIVVIIFSCPAIISDLPELQREQAALEWLPFNDEWTYLYVDEIIPSESNILSSTTDPAQRNFTLSDALGDEYSLVNFLAGNPSVIRRILFTDASVLAQHMSGTPSMWENSVYEWYHSIRALFDDHSNNKSATGRLINEAITAFFSMHRTHPLPPYRAVVGTSVREMMLSRARTMTINTALHMLGILFSTSTEVSLLADGSGRDVHDFKEALLKWLTESTDRHTWANSVLFQLDMTTALACYDVVSMADVRSRHPLFCRPQTVAAVSLPCSFILYRLAHVGDGQFVESMPACAASTWFYTCDALRFFFEEAALWTECDSFSTDIIWIIKTLLILDGKIPTTAFKDEGQLATRLERVFAQEAAWLMSSFLRALDAARDNVQYIQWIRENTEKGSTHCFPSSDTFYLCLAGATLPGDNVPPPFITQRLRPSPRELVYLLSRTTASDDTQHRIRLLLLSYSLFPDDSTAHDRPLYQLLCSFLSCATQSLGHAARWLCDQAPAQDEYVLHHISPLLVAYFSYYGSDILWMEHCEAFIHSFTTAEGVVLCPHTVLYYVLRRTFRFWIRDANAQVDFDCFGDACRYQSHSLLPHLLVHTVSEELHETADNSGTAGILSLWSRLISGVKDADAATQSPIQLYMCLGFLKWYIPAAYCVFTKEGNTTELSTGHTSWVEHLTKMMREFQSAWRVFMDSHACSDDDLFVEHGIYLYFLRVFSGDGMMLSRGKDALRQCVSDEECHEDLFLKQLYAVGAPPQPSTLHVLLHDDFIHGQPFNAEVKSAMSDCILLLEGEEHHSTDKSNMVMISEVFRKRRVSSLRTTMGNMWDTESVYGLSGILLTLLGATNRDSYFLKVLEGQEEAVIHLRFSDFVRLNDPTTTSGDVAKIIAMHRFLRAVAAFGSSLLQRTEDIIHTPSDDDFRSILDNWVTRLFPFCPNCGVTFVDFDACTVLHCSCKQSMCGWCFAVIGDSDATHEHVSKCAMNPAAPGFFVKREVWAERYIHNHFKPRLQALEQGHLHYMTETGLTIQFVSPTKENMSAVMQLQECSTRWSPLLRLLAYEALTSSETLLPKALRTNSLIIDLLSELLDPIPLQHYDVCMAELQGATRELSDCFQNAIPRGSSYASLLRFVLSYTGLHDLKEVSDLRPVDVPREFDLKAHVRRIDTLMRVDGQDADSRLRDFVSCGPLFDKYVASLTEKKHPWAQLILLFDNASHVSDQGAVAKFLSESESSRCPISHLHRLRDSFSLEAAQRTCDVLRFAFDARRIVSQNSWCARDLHDMKVTHLTCMNPNIAELFPLSRVERVISSCKQMLEHLSRGDNNCHEDQNYTMAAADTPDDVDLSELLLTETHGNGGLLNVLFTGSDDVVQDGSPSFVGFGNSEYGQNSVLDALSAQCGMPPCRTDTSQHPFLLEPTDFLAYDPSWTEHLVHMSRYTGLAIFANAERGPCFCDDAFVRCAVCSSAGLIGRPRLGSLPALEVGCPWLYDALLGVVDYVSDRISDTMGEEGHEGCSWLETVREVSEASGIIHSTTATRSDFFCFLVAYLRYFASVFRDHTYTAPRASEDHSHPPPPSFDAVPAAMLSDRQRHAQEVLSAAAIDTRHVPMLLILFFSAEPCTLDPVYLEPLLLPPPALPPASTLFREEVLIALKVVAITAHYAAVSPRISVGSRLDGFFYGPERECIGGDGVLDALPLSQIGSLIHTLVSDS